MSIESIGAAALGIGPSAGDAVRTLRFDNFAGNSDNLSVKFSEAMGKASGATPVAGSNDIPAPVRGLFNALDNVNTQAKSVSDYAAAAEANDGQLTPGEIVQLTMKCQEFMFQCQLTSNIANRSSEGVTQLFRQQG